VLAKNYFQIYQKLSSVYEIVSAKPQLEGTSYHSTENEKKSSKVTQLHARVIHKRYDLAVAPDTI
jgi:hypothetical protein